MLTGAIIVMPCIGECKNLSDSPSDKALRKMSRRYFLLGITTMCVGYALFAGCCYLSK